MGTRCSSQIIFSTNIMRVDSLKISGAYTTWMNGEKKHSERSKKDMKAWKWHESWWFEVVLQESTGNDWEIAEVFMTISIPFPRISIYYLLQQLFRLPYSSICSFLNYLYLHCYRKVLSCVACGRLKTAFQIASRSGSIPDVQYVSDMVWSFLFYSSYVFVVMC